MFENILLGIIQGLTEFLPVSSSGHLVLFSHFLTKQDGNLILEVLLHLGTMLATVLIFRREILNLLRGLLKREKASIQLAMNIIIASIPTAIIGFTLKGFFERAFSAPALVCFLMVLTGLMLFFTKFIDNSKEIRQIGFREAFFIGLAQSIAILPGVSRSGSTICMALFCRTGRKEAGEFSFLISLPAICGATLLTFKDWFEGGGDLSQLGLGPILGVISSFIVGLFALMALLKFVNQGKMHVFSYYMFGVGGLGFIYFLFF